MNYELEKALFAYVVSFLVIFLILIFFFKKQILNSFIFSLILSQIFLNIIFLPTKYNIFSELTNTNALYILIQFATPVVAYVYSLKKSMF